MGSIVVLVASSTLDFPVIQAIPFPASSLVRGRWRGMEGEPAGVITMEGWKVGARLVASFAGYVCFVGMACVVYVVIG